MTGRLVGEAHSVSHPSRLLTPRFLLICVASSLYFMGLNLTLSVLPLFVKQDLGGTSTQVGMAVGAFGVAAAMVRPIAGSIGDTRGRRTLIMGGATVAGLATALLAFAGSIPAVIAMRMLAGFGEAGLFVGAASAIQDLSPTDRRGEAASYFSLTIYGSVALGPPVGEFVSNHWSTDATWLLAGTLAISAALVGSTAPGAPSDAPVATGKRKFLHPAALRPGVVMFLGLLGYTSFLAFAAVHAEEIGITNTGTVFTVFAAVVLILRIVAARLPDALGPILTTRISLSFGVAGLLILWAWREPTGVYVGAAVIAVAQTFLFPALFALVVDTAPDSERSHAIGSFSMFFDLAFGIGGPLIGIVADATDRPTGFLVAAVIAAIALASSGRIIGDVEPTTKVAEVGPRSRR